LKKVKHHNLKLTVLDLKRKLKESDSGEKAQ